MIRIIQEGGYIKAISFYDKIGVADIGISQNFPIGR
jgi:hypothetical protein